MSESKNRIYDLMVRELTAASGIIYDLRNLDAHNQELPDTYNLRISERDRLIREALEL